MFPPVNGHKETAATDVTAACGYGARRIASPTTRAGKTEPLWTRGAGFLSVRDGAGRPVRVGRAGMRRSCQASTRDVVKKNYGDANSTTCQPTAPALFPSARFGNSLLYAVDGEDVSTVV